MQLTFARSANRHGVSQERAAYVVRHCVAPLYPADDPKGHHVVMFLGFDQHGVPLEVAAVESGPDELLVIHAMRIRARLRSDLERVLSDRRR